jgi:glycosyltransferase involved in cell wall biosynthesis
VVVRILAFGTYQATSHPRISVLIEGLRSHGHQVAEANVPLGLSTAERVDMLGSAAGPLRLVGKLARSWIRLAGKTRRARGRNAPDALLIGYMGHFDVWLARVLFPRTTIVLDHLIYASTTAVDRGVGGGGLKQRVLRLLDRSAIRLADVVLLDTQEHLDLLPPGSAHKGLVVAVGAPGYWFVDRPADPAGEAAAGGAAAGGAADGPLRVVFFGLFTPLQGAVTIGEAIALLGDAPVEFTMIGSGQDLDAAKRAAAGGAPTTWVPWVDSAELPATVASFDVGLGIFGTTDKAQRVVPNKVYQCEAAGTAVITSDTEAQRRILADSADLVPAGDAAALAAAVRALADDRERLARRRADARAWADARFTPAAVTAPLDEVLRAR